MTATPRRIALVSALVFLAAMGFLALTVALDPDGSFTGSSSFWALLALFTLVHLKPHRVFSRRQELEAIQLDELLFVPMLVLLTPSEMLVVVFIASLVGNVFAARRPLVKTAFNVGQLALASAAGLAAFSLVGELLGHPVGEGFPVETVTVLAAVVGAFTVTVVSMVAVAMMVSWVTNGSLQSMLTEAWRPLTWTPPIALGTLGMLAALTHPVAVVLALGVALFMQQSYQSALSQRLARRQAEALQEAVSAMRGRADSRSIWNDLQETSKQLLAARSATIVPADAADASNALGALVAPVDAGSAISVEDRIGGGAWRPEERTMLTTLAATAADLLRSAGLIEHLKAITDGQGEAVLAMDEAGVLTFANPAALRMLDVEEDVVGSRLADLCAFHHAGIVVDVTAVAASSGPVRDADATLHTLTGLRTPIAYSLTPLSESDEAEGTVLVFRDITERHAFQEALAHQAYHDALTGLPNRRLFADRVDHALGQARRQGAQHALLYCDLDRFKLVNDSYGHLAGDELLVTVAARLTAALRGTDTLARLSGDEFAVLLEDVTTIDEATDVASRILDALSEPFDVRGAEVYVSASIGVVLSDPDSTLETLLAAADTAAYAAKANGKGCYEVFTQASIEESKDRLALETSLHRALERGEFELHYQPVMRSGSTEIHGVEALVRWNSPDKGLVPPVTFIPLAEETGFILPLGAWVLEDACRQLREWTSAYPDRDPLTVAVNLSARQFNRREVVEEVASIIERSGVDPSQLCLEITETAVMADTGATLTTLNALKALGVKVAIDDFGTGYSSLSYLKTFPVDTVKVDRSFVAGLGTEQVDTEIVTAVVRLAAAVGMDAVAEGVETSRQAEHLQRLGCPLLQGYLYSKPLPAREFEAFWDAAATPVLPSQRSLEAPRGA